MAQGTPFVPSDAVARIRARLDHPVIDGDGHQIEFMPLVRDHVVDLAGAAAATHLDALVASGTRVLELAPGDERRRRGLFRTGWWSVPTANTLDRATCTLPALLHRRLDEIGLDFAVLYPTYGFFAGLPTTPELRAVFARAFNRYSAEVFEGLRDRLEPVAVIPMTRPEEAVAELHYAVGELGLKAVMLSGLVARPWPGAEDGTARWQDTLAHDSDFDYEPVWRACAELGVAPAFHSGGQGWGTRMSTRNYLYNHVGSFAAAAESAARALFFGGVPVRHPDLRFVFLEGGVAWAAALHADLVGHWAKRNGEAVLHYDPAALDRGLLESLFDEHARGRVHDGRDRLDYGIHLLSEPVADRSVLDEFASSGVTGPEDISQIFRRQYHFGCEADDPMNALAFDTALNPGGVRLNAVFGSDLGHWDVPDLRDVLPEAWELVEHGRITEADFRDFTCDNPRSLYGPDFFRDTVVA
ncbi:MAG: amidohydrolase family protein [Acidimicrobiia bacterium]